MPVFLYFFPVLGHALLEPLVRYQAAGLYPNQWGVHDVCAQSFFMPHSRCDSQVRQIYAT
ncbi:hypothetical protein B0H15DRAFT_847453 [Mycena belliarum]|uniref:Glutaminase A central domain-containing protein n=1 Tax=Mycena belliarum TaxID=1033014 RepID=A0AAD6XMM8_9AGAR|nr:hypothetical protein B0H15DRAFT_847453 [Mycena belliae]